jgi:hypothetical protein
MDFEEQIKRGYRKKMSERGDCPASDDLIRYQKRELSTGQMLLIKQHVDVCGFCDCAVAELSELDSSEYSGETKTAIRKGFIPRFLLHPALAYGIVLALLYPAYRGLIQPDLKPQKTVDGVGSAIDFDLGQGSPTRSVSHSKEIVVSLSQSEEYFILTFFVPVRSLHRYEMEIRNEQGNVIESGVIRSRDTIGNFSIVAANQLFPVGIYKLTVKEVELANGAVKNEYHFQFRIDRT